MFHFGTYHDCCRKCNGHEGKVAHDPTQPNEAVQSCNAKAGSAMQKQQQQCRSGNCVVQAAQVGSCISLKEMQEKHIHKVQEIHIQSV